MTFYASFFFFFFTLLSSWPSIFRRIFLIHTKGSKCECQLWTLKIHKFAPLQMVSVLHNPFKTLQSTHHCWSRWHNCVHEATKGKKRRNRVNRNEWWEHVIVGDNQFSTNSLTVLWGLCWLRFGALCWLRFVTGLPFWDTSSMPQGPNPHMSVLLVEIWGDLEVCFRSVPPNRHDILYRSIWGLGKHKWWKWSLTLILMY